MTLTPADRVRAAEELLRSVGDPEQGEIDAAWAVEAEERIRAYEAGEAQATPGDEVLRRILGRKRNHNGR